MQIHFPTNKKGFTLIEIMVSISIFGLLMVCFLTMFSVSLNLTVRAGNKDKGVDKVTGQIERQMAQTSYDNSMVAASSTTVTLYFANSSQATVPVTKTTGQTTTSDGQTVTIVNYTP